MNRKLTIRQAEILRYVKNCITKIDRPPTRKEIADHFNFSSANASQDVLKAIERKGYIRLCKSKSRGIEVVENYVVFNKPKKEINMDNEFAQLIKERGGVTAVSRLTGFTRSAIYKWINANGITSPLTKEILKARGINPRRLVKTI